MTASQLHTLPVPPMLMTPNANGSGNNPINNRIIISNNTNSRSRAKRNLFGAPPPGEIKRICDEDNRKKCMEIKLKYNFDVETDRFITTTTNNNIKNNNNSNNNNENQITTTTPPPPPTTTTIVVTTSSSEEEVTTNNNNNNHQINELINNGQDEQSNINKLLATDLSIIIIDNNNVASSNKKSITTSNKKINIITPITELDNSSECDIMNNDKLSNDDNDDDDVNKKLGISNIKSLNDDNDNNKLNSFNQCDVMCNQINSTTTTSTSQQIVVGKDKKLIDQQQQQNQRFQPYCNKKQSQPLVSDMFKVRKASPVINMTRPQIAKLHSDDTIDHQQQQQQQLE